MNRVSRFRAKFQSKHIDLFLSEEKKKQQQVRDDDEIINTL